MHAGAAQGGISVLPSQYPPVHRDNVTNDFFGTVVADPYRWLEDTDSPETLACELLQHSGKGFHCSKQHLSVGLYKNRLCACCGHLSHLCGCHERCVLRMLIRGAPG